MGGGGGLLPGGLGGLGGGLGGLGGLGGTGGGGVVGTIHTVRPLASVSMSTPAELIRAKGPLPGRLTSLDQYTAPLLSLSCSAPLPLSAR